MIKNGYGNNGMENNLIESNDIKLKSKKDKLIDTESKNYYCKFCANKKFKSQKYLDEHMQRRHINELDSEREYQEIRENIIKDKNYKEMFDKKLNTLNEILYSKGYYLQQHLSILD